MKSKSSNSCYQYLKEKNDSIGIGLAINVSFKVSNNCIIWLSKTLTSSLRVGLF